MNSPSNRCWPRLPVALSASIACLAMALIVSACGQSTSEYESVRAEPVEDEEPRLNEPPEVVIDSPLSGETVVSPLRITASTKNFRLAKAGTVSDGEGHLHLIVNKPCVAAGEVIEESRHFHRFGSGTNVLELDLEPGDYDLCIQAGDGFHVALGVPGRLSVTVAE